MKKESALLLVAILLGCVVNQSGIQVHNLKTDEGFMFSGNSGFYDEIVPVPIDSQFIYSMYRENDHLALVKRSLSEDIIKKP